MMDTAKGDQQHSLEQKWLVLRKKHSQWKKGLTLFYNIFSQLVSWHTLKFALNKSMHMSDDEQGINKLWPNEGNSKHSN